VNPSGESPAQIRALPLRARTEWLLRRFGIRPRKALGQNFLVNEGAARRIAETAVAPGLPLLEIGGGLGALSVPLADSGLPLTVVEIDERAAEALAWLLGDLPHVRVLRADILQVDLWALAATALPGALSRQERGGGEETAAGVAVAREGVTGVLAGPSPSDRRPATGGSALLTAVGNLPYSSTGAILQRLWAPDSPCGRIVVTVQREVAERLRAEPGSKAWGPLSVLAALHTEGRQVLARLSPESFLPAPKVESTALMMERRVTPPAGLPNWEAVGRALRGAFGARRKTLSNSLRFGLQLEPGQVRAVLHRAGLEGRRRGETLDLEELLALARALGES